MIKLGVRGCSVAIARLDRDREALFKPTTSVDGILTLNNFEFTAEGTMTVNRQYEIGVGKVWNKNILMFGNFR